MNMLYNSNSLFGGAKLQNNMRKIYRLLHHIPIWETSNNKN